MQVIPRIPDGINIPYTHFIDHIVRNTVIINIFPSLNFRFIPHCFKPYYVIGVIQGMVIVCILSYISILIYPV